MDILYPKLLNTKATPTSYIFIFLKTLLNNYINFIKFINGI